MSRKELEYQKIGDFYLPKVTLPAEDDKLDKIDKYYDVDNNKYHKLIELNYLGANWA